MSDWLRLSFRLQRFELIAITIGIVIWGLVGLVVAWRLTGYVHEYPACFGLTNHQTPEVAKFCEAAAEGFGAWDQFSEILLWMTLGIPVLVGLVLGVPIVAQEIEQRSSQFAWSLTQDRVRWLTSRTVPIAAVVIVLLIVTGAIAEVVTLARVAGDDPGFVRYDQRGVLVVVRGTLAFAVGLWLGAWIGRTLPALLLGAAITTVLIAGTVLGMDVWRRGDSQVVQLNSLASASLENGLVMEQVARLPDGTVTSERRADRLPAGTEFDFVRVLPSSEYWTWIMRESAALGAWIVLAIGAALMTTRGRRPY